MRTDGVDWRDIKMKIRTYQNKRNKRKYIEVHNDGHHHNSVRQYNNYEGYSKGFLFATDIIKGFENVLKLLNMDHFNTWIYSAKFKVM